MRPVTKGAVNALARMHLKLGSFTVQSEGAEWQSYWNGTIVLGN